MQVLLLLNQIITPKGKCTILSGLFSPIEIINAQGMNCAVDKGLLLLIHLTTDLANFKNFKN